MVCYAKNILTLAAVGVALFFNGSVSAEPNRCALGEAKFMSWAPRERAWTHSDGVLKIEANAEKNELFQFNERNGAPFLAAFAAGPSYRISFTYRSTAKAKLHYEFCTMEKPKTPYWFDKPLPVSEEWMTFTWDAPAPQQDCENVQLRLVCEKGSGYVEMKDLSIVDVELSDRSGKPLLVNGAKATEVCLYANGSPRERANELRAALMFRFALCKAGGEWLPVREVASADEAGAAAVLIGRLAVDAGVVEASELAKVAGLTGGWATAAKGSRLGLAGAVPVGIQRGTWKILERLGIVYLGADIFKPFSGTAFATEDFAETVVPATAFPLAGDRSGLNAELRGWADWGCVFGDHSIGSVPESWGRLSCDSLGYIIPVGEFRETHPEYFALQADGTRLIDDKHAKGLTHFCWSAPGLAETIAERFLEMMRALPVQPIWIVAPGDGGGLNCKCEKCKAIGSDSDGLIRLLNRVAEITSKEFPENLVWTYSYVDTPEPPKNPVRIHENANLGYCVYPDGYWPSCMVIPHAANAKGMKALEGWRRECCANLSLVAYYSQCGEWMTYWPGYDADLWLTRDFGEHHSLLTYRFGLHSTHRNGQIGDASSFTDALIYAMSRMEVDPSLDGTKLVHEFINLFYGDAAKLMHKVYDLSAAEPHKRDWVQGCEQHLKGFVSKDFAAKVFPLFDEMEKIAADDSALLNRIRKVEIPFYWSYLDGIGRGRGNVSKEELKPWAHRVAKFAKMCEENGMCYMGNVTPKRWFHDNLIYDIETEGHSTSWPKDKKVQALIADPENTLAGDFPNLQTAIPEGFRIPAAGMMGGEFMKNCFWRNKEGIDVRVVRRESSGLGLLFTRLDLETEPKGPSKLILRGIDNEKEAPAEIEVSVNGTVVYRGDVKFTKDAHTDWDIPLAEGILKVGANEINLRNPTRDTEVDGAGGDRFAAPRNYFWGWFMIDEIRWKITGRTFLK